MTQQVDSTTIKLCNLINAKFPIIAVRTFETSRVMGEVAQIAAASNHVGKTILSWSMSGGLRKIDYTGTSNDGIVSDTEITNPASMGLKEIKTYSAPQGAMRAALDLSGEVSTLFVVYNYHHYFKDPTIQQLILDVADAFTVRPHTLIMIGSNFEFPHELSKAVTILDWPLPNAEILSEAVDRVGEAVQAKWHLPVDLSDRGAIVRALQGMTYDEAQGAMSYLVATMERFDSSSECIHMLTDRKAQAIKQTAALEYWPSEETLDNVGGLEKLKEYAEDAASVYSDAAEAFGAVPPRGCLLVGLPGTGKSLFAKVIANRFGVPLVRLDMGAVFEGLVGASERRMSVALTTVEAIAPCVLMLDEIDKGGGSSGGQRSDGGTGARVLATLLTWLQERARPAKVFCCMTANGVDTINPALFRRVDQFFVPLPGPHARAEILRIHLRKAGRDADALGIDVQGIAAEAENYSGAELEEAVLAAIRKAFKLWRGEQDISGDLLMQSLRDIRPVAVTMREELAHMVEWGKSARTASDTESDPEESVKGGKRRASVLLPESL